MLLVGLCQAVWVLGWGVWRRRLRCFDGSEAGLTTGQRTIDVGCGSGALTTVLVDRIGVRSVAAVDPSPEFLAAVQARHPGVLARLAAAEALPFEDAEFDAAVAQLVVHFMADPVAGLREKRMSP
ncbi:class I SAM-dependent methyltransferase [Conexibacter sp. S30A1]|uniref:class I SAM-dependent methyltransferase n=1 Tax=Conexibacter sp. S30A1 TaxID=2937800 RepID=UPI00200C8B46|nr:class I SAM-dependent methyltransferase [Conexibacter sp. S30A1]